jgi:hypothetical protein
LTVLWRILGCVRRNVFVDKMRRGLSKDFTVHTLATLGANPHWEVLTYISCGTVLDVRHSKLYRLIKEKVTTTPKPPLCKKAVN